MADWSNIPDSALDPDAPLTSELAYGWRDNPIAISEGAPGAPRIEQPALLESVGGAGVTISSVSVSSTSPISNSVALVLGCIAGGSVSITAAASGSGTVQVGRIRNGAFTSLGGSGTTVVSFLYGDMVVCRWTNGAGTGGATFSANTTQASPRIMVIGPFNV